MDLGSGDAPGAAGGLRAGAENSTVLPSLSGLLHSTKPICPLGVAAQLKFETKIWKRFIIFQHQALKPQALNLGWTGVKLG